jgi:hypothetical protein
MFSSFLERNFPLSGMDTDKCGRWFRKKLREVENQAMEASALMRRL